MDRAGRIYIPSMVQTKEGEPSRGIPWVRWSAEGKALDTLWVPRGPEEKNWTVSAKDASGKNASMMSTSIPFRPSLAYTLDPDGGFVLGWSEAYSIVRSRTGADSVRVFGRSWAPDPVTDERRNSELESRIKGAVEHFGEAKLRAAFHVSDIPSTLPAYLNLRVDEAGRVWARRYAVADTTKSYFDVFDDAGAYLGPVTAPFKMSELGVQAWTKDGVVTVIEDDDGRPTVVRLKLQIR